jgi:hypothetical protein
MGSASAWRYSMQRSPAGFPAAVIYVGALVSRMQLLALRARHEKCMWRTVPKGSELSLASRPSLHPFTVHLMSMGVKHQ